MTGFVLFFINKQINLQSISVVMSTITIRKEDTK